MRSGDVIKAKNELTDKLTILMNDQGFYAQAFIPETATVGQLNKFLFLVEEYYDLGYDAKNDDAEEAGIDLVFWCDSGQIENIVESLVNMQAGIYQYQEKSTGFWM